MANSVSVKLALDIKSFEAQLDKAISKVQAAASNIKDGTQGDLFKNAFKSLNIKPLADIKTEIEKVKTSLSTIKNTAGASSVDIQRAMVAAKQRVAELNAEGKKTGASLGDKLPAIAGGFYLVRSAVDGVIASFSGLVSITDKYTGALNKLSVVDGIGNVGKQLDSLFKISNESRTGIDATVSLFTRLSRALEPLGSDAAEVERIVSTLSKSFVVAGLAPSEVSSALLQLSQAFNKGKLDGDEFRSVMENFPQLGDAVAKSMGGTRGELFKLSEDGKITTEVLRKAVIDMEATVSEKFEKTGLTVGQSLQIASNNFTQFIGKIDQATGFSSALAKVIVTISENLGAIAVTVAAVGAGIAAYFAPTILAGIASGFAAITLGFKAFTAALLANPFAAVAVVIVGVIAYLVAFQDEINLIETTTAESLKNGERSFITLGDAVSGTLDYIGDRFVETYDIVSQFFSDLVSDSHSANGEIEKDTQSLTEAQQSWWAVSLDAIVAAVVAWNVAIGKIWSNLGTITVNVAKGIANNTIGAFEIAVNGVIGLINGAISSLNKLGEVANGINAKLGGDADFFGKVASLNNVKFDRLKKEAVGVGDAFNAAFDDVIANSPSKALLSSIAAASSKRTAAEDAERAAERAAEDAARAAEKAAEDAARAAEKAAKDAARAAEKAAKEIEKQQDELNKSIIEKDKAQAEARRKVAEDELKFQDEINKRRLEAGQLSIEQYNAMQLKGIVARAAIQRQALQDELDALDKQKADIEAKAASGKLSTAQKDAQLNQVAGKRATIEADLKISEQSIREAKIKLRDETFKATQEADAVLIKMRFELDESQGGIAGARAAIEKEQNANLAAVKTLGLDNETTAQLTTQANLLAQQKLALVEIKQIENERSLSLAELNVKQAELDASKAQGRITEAQYEAQSLAIAQQRYAVEMQMLKAQLARLQSAPQTLEVQKQILATQQQIAAVNMAKPLDKAQQAAKSWDETLTEIKNNAVNEIANGLTDAMLSVADGTKKAKDAFKDFAVQFLKDIAKMILEAIILNAVQTGMNAIGLSKGGAVGDGGSQQNLATGGFVSGAGTATSDSIPARLSNGEFVHQAKAVNFYGKRVMDDINNMRIPKIKVREGNLPEISKTRAVQKYATGGMVQPSAAPQVNVQMVNNGTPQTVTRQQVEYDTIKGMMIKLFTDDLRNNGTMAQSLRNSRAVQG